MALEEEYDLTDHSCRARGKSSLLAVYLRLRLSIQNLFMTIRRPRKLSVAASASSMSDRE